MESSSTEHTSLLRLKVLMRNAESNMVLMRSEDRKQEATYYSGMAQGLRRAISTLEGKG